MFVTATVVLSALTVLAVVLITLFLPGNPGNTAVIATIVGVTAPITIALVGAAVNQVHVAVNSRLTELIALTAAASKAEGVLQQKALRD
jgi:hypothetical protein